MLVQEREFRIWEFLVSHDQLLIRSPRTERHPKNVDIVFAGVEYLDIPTKITGLSIESATPSDAAIVGRRHSLTQSDQIYVLSVSGGRYYVVAASMRVIENELDIFESSLERF